jgi:hypothetical protein
MQKREAGRRSHGRHICKRPQSIGDGFANRDGANMGTPAGVGFAKWRRYRCAGLTDRCGIGSLAARRRRRVAPRTTRGLMGDWREGIDSAAPISEYPIV